MQLAWLVVCILQRSNLRRCIPWKFLADDLKQNKLREPHITDTRARVEWTFSRHAFFMISHRKLVICLSMRNSCYTWKFTIDCFARLWSIEFQGLRRVCSPSCHRLEKRKLSSLLQFVELLWCRASSTRFSRCLHLENQLALISRRRNRKVGQNYSPGLWFAFCKDPIFDWAFLRLGEGALPTSILFIGISNGKWHEAKWKQTLGEWRR